jgi:ATP-dependent Lhr-like helicase
VWWTFGGQKANASLAPTLASLAQSHTVADNLAIEFERAIPLDAVQRATEELRCHDPGSLLPAVSPEALEGMKFSECLPQALAEHVLEMRGRDPLAVQHVLGATVRFVSGGAGKPCPATAPDRSLTSETEIDTASWCVGPATFDNRHDGRANPKE